MHQAADRVMTTTEECAQEITVSGKLYANGGRQQTAT